MQRAQHIAAQAVAAVLAGRNVEEALLQYRKPFPDLSAADRGASQDLAFGTLRHWGLLAALTEGLFRQPPADRVLAALLPVALYQLLFTRATEHTIVNEAVSLAGHLNPRMRGLINAVLRTFLREKEARLEAARATPEGQWNHPTWWIQSMRRAYPREWETILTANQTHPPFCLRVNLQKTTVEAYLGLLEEAGLRAKAVGEQAILLDKAVPVTQLPHFEAGWVSVQDLGAQYAAALLAPQAGMRVLDACAAPGGKTGHLLEWANCSLLALDKEGSRLQRVRQNLDRLGLEATLKVGDASQPKTWWDGQAFDRILADVPCSATGVVRRHPDIKWLRRAEDFAGFARQQKMILEALWGCLAKGGRLLYATCSVFPQENEGVITDFLKKHPEAQHLPTPVSHLLPTAEHDGFFYALLEKNAL